MRRCLFRLPASVHEYLHCEQAKGFSPLWTSLCFFRWLGLLVEKLHWLQMCFFFKSARSLVLRSFVRTTVGVSMLQLSLFSIATRSDNNWWNFHCKEGKFYKCDGEDFCRPPKNKLAAVYWRGGGKYYFGQLSLFIEYMRLKPFELGNFSLSYNEVVSAASSVFFQNLFFKSRHMDPIISLKWVYWAWVIWRLLSIFSIKNHCSSSLKSWNWKGWLATNQVLL